MSFTAFYEQIEALRGISADLELQANEIEKKLPKWLGDDYNFILLIKTLNPTRLSAQKNFSEHLFLGSPKSSCSQILY